MSHLHSSVVCFAGGIGTAQYYTTVWDRGGQLIWFGGHFEKATFGGGPHLLSEIEASLR